MPFKASKENGFHEDQLVGASTALFARTIIAAETGPGTTIAGQLRNWNPGAAHGDVLGNLAVCLSIASNRTCQGTTGPANLLSTKTRRRP